VPLSRTHLLHSEPDVWFVIGVHVYVRGRKGENERQTEVQREG